MDFTAHKKRIVIYLSVWLVILSSFLFMGAKAYRQADQLILCNATDTLMALIEIKAEAGGNYIKAKADHVEMLRQYVGHMDSRHLSFLLKLPPFSNKNVAKELDRVAEDLNNVDPLNAREAIETASKSIAEFLSQLKPFTGEPITTCGPEVVSQELKSAIKNSLQQSHEKIEIFANDPNMTNSEEACWANRRAAAYLYLARFGYHEIVSQEELRRFRTDMNRCVYYNRVLQQTDISEKERTRLIEYSNSEIRRLQLLQAIMDNNIQQAQLLLLIAIKDAFPNNQFSGATR